MNWTNFVTTLLLGFGFYFLRHHDDMPANTWREWLRSGPSAIVGWALLYGAVARLTP